MTSASATTTAIPSAPGRGTVFVVDDESNLRFILQATLERAGYRVRTFETAQSAAAELSRSLPDLLISDLSMPGMDGMELLRHCQARHPSLPVVMLTAFGTVESAVAALKRGAFDFITKPFEQTELLSVVAKGVETSRQRAKEPASLPDAGAGAASQGAPAVSSIIGLSAPMQEVFRVISKIAASPSTVLIRGESGTGKELVAEEIHRNSPRAGKPFVKVNCAAIPATLIESELFGHERGAFTGAVSAKPGRFELAHEGTLFLDEVGEMSLEMQVKLLRVLQQQEFERVGGVNTVRVDVRIVTATNRDLDAEVKAGRFREDLFYRLNVVPIHLPPLRERRDDIDMLVKTFLAEFNRKFGKQVSRLSPLTRQAFRTYSWPGNIRQLENAIERMVLLADGETLEARDLPEEILRDTGLAALPQLSPGATAPGAMVADAGVDSGLSFKEIVKRQTQSLERELIERALDEMGGNVTRTAEKLGLSRKGLQLKMKELGIRRGDDEDSSASE